ncbi:hypothetical protein C1H84_14130 [Glutamicibacter soli]|uniref:Uncharacterized protein n=1 Tax=Glutamicibacter soli TaxID=453836 RepID=A0A365YC34_9MICC|nr:hypothetical protein C1H84_14130 [Glutamicibacter soli]
MNFLRQRKNSIVLKQISVIEEIHLRLRNGSELLVELISRYRINWMSSSLGPVIIGEKLFQDGLLRLPVHLRPF